MMPSRCRQPARVVFAIEEGSQRATDFSEALEALMIGLAQDIVRDGEGATKFVEIRVAGGESEAACDQVARTIAHSPLVKTALFRRRSQLGAAS